MSSKVAKRTRSSLPTRSTAPIRGKRSGVSMNSKLLQADGTQEMDDFFEAHQPSNNPMQHPVAKQTKTPRKKGKSKSKTKTPKVTMNMKLPGAGKDEEEGVEGRTKKYLRKIGMSPSELSNVSTAPPTPDDVEEARFAQDDDEDPIPEDVGGEEEVVAAQAAEKDNSDKPQLLDVDEDNEMDLGPPAPSDDDDFDMGHDDYDDKEGEGFNMVHDPETPASVRKRRKEEEEEEIAKKGKKKKRKTSFADDQSKDDGDEVTPAKKKSKKNKKRHVVFSPQGIPTAPRSYKAVPVASYVEPSPEEEGVRRSRRARTKPLAFWKNEKFEYGAHDEVGELGNAMGDMPIVVNVIKALPTPYKKRTEPKKGAKKAGRKKTVDADESVVEVEEFDTRKLRKKYNVIDGDIANLWDDNVDDSVDLSKCLAEFFVLSPCSPFVFLTFTRYHFTEVVSYAEDMEGSELPMSASRSKAEGKVVGRAAQAFNIPNEDSESYVGYIMGNLVLPAKGIKDAESVGPCSQTFTVCTAQPKALEVAYGDPDAPEGTLEPETAQRFYLGPGDLFRVPPGNSYRLQNHSKTTPCVLTWTIIRPRALGPSS